MTEPDPPTPPIEDFPICEWQNFEGKVCGQQHARWMHGRWHRTCAAHVEFERITPEERAAGKQRPRLEHPRPCAFISKTKTCRNHGQTQRARDLVAAEETSRKAGELAVKFGVIDPSSVNTIEAVLTSIALVTAQAAFYFEKVNALSDGELIWGETRNKIGEGENGTEVVYEAGKSMWLKLLDEANDKRFKMAAEATRIGIEAKRVADAQETGRQFVAVNRAVLHDPELALTDAQKDAAERVLLRHLRALPSAA